MIFKIAHQTWIYWIYVSFTSKPSYLPGGFNSGEPFSFERHVLCCTKINDPIVHCMIICIQCGNKHLFLMFTSLVCLFFFTTFFLQTLFPKVSNFFTINKNLIVCLMSFVKQCNIFCNFTFFFVGNLMKQLNNDESKVNILGGHRLQIRDQVIKRWEKVHE